MKNINPIYKINNPYLLAFKQHNKVEDNKVSNPIDTDISMNGLDALANYNKKFIDTTNPISRVYEPCDAEYALSSDEYMAEVHRTHMLRDNDGDGEVSIDETLAKDYLVHKYPDLGEEDREALIKYAMADGNVNVNNEEFVRWLNGPEHMAILRKFKVRESEEIKNIEKYKQ